MIHSRQIKSRELITASRPIKASLRSIAPVLRTVNYQRATMFPLFARFCTILLQLLSAFRHDHFLLFYRIFFYFLFQIYSID